jgi:hypothetical protein
MQVMIILSLCLQVMAYRACHNNDANVENLTECVATAAALTHRAEVLAIMHVDKRVVGPTAHSGFLSCRGVDQSGTNVGYLVNLCRPSGGSMV